MDEDSSLFKVKFLLLISIFFERINDGGEGNK